MHLIETLFARMLCHALIHASTFWQVQHWVTKSLSESVSDTAMRNDIYSRIVSHLLAELPLALPEPLSAADVPHIAVIGRLVLLLEDWLFFGTISANWSERSYGPDRMSPIRPSFSQELRRCADGDDTAEEVDADASDFVDISQAGLKWSDSLVAAPLNVHADHPTEQLVQIFEVSRSCPTVSSTVRLFVPLLLLDRSDRLAGSCRPDGAERQEQQGKARRKAKADCRAMPGNV
jgi:hypothetical protein